MTSSEEGRLERRATFHVERPRTVVFEYQYGKSTPEFVKTASKPACEENESLETEGASKKLAEYENKENRRKSFPSEETTTKPEEPVQFSDEVPIAKRLPTVDQFSSLDSNQFMFKRHSSLADQGVQSERKLQSDALLGQSCPATSAFVKYQKPNEAEKSERFVNTLVRGKLAQDDKTKVNADEEYQSTQKTHISDLQAHEAAEKSPAEILSGQAYDSVEQSIGNQPGPQGKVDEPPPVEKGSVKSLSNKLLVSTELSSSGRTSGSEFEVINGDDEVINGDDEIDVRTVEADTNHLAFPLCNCSCEGWAEILIRRPTGNTSWIMKIENFASNGSASGKLDDVMTLTASLLKEDGNNGLGKS